MAGQGPANMGYFYWPNKNGDSHPISLHAHLPSPLPAPTLILTHLPVVEGRVEVPWRQAI